MESLTNTDKKDAMTVIDNYNGRESYDVIGKTLAYTNAKDKTVGFRIDVQKPAILGKGQNRETWTNLQVQKNSKTKTKNKEPTTVSQIFFRKGSNPTARQLKDAFELSFNEIKIVCMQVSKNKDEPCPLS